MSFYFVGFRLKYSLQSLTGNTHGINREKCVIFRLYLHAATVIVQHALLKMAISGLKTTFRQRLIFAHHFAQYPRNCVQFCKK